MKTLKCKVRSIIPHLAFQSEVKLAQRLKLRAMICPFADALDGGPQQTLCKESVVRLLSVTTVVSDDFGTITCFSVTISAASLGIARPRYQIHRMRGARVSAKRFREF